MITKPVIAVKAIPKDATTGQLYYIEGARGSMKSLDEKRKNFVAGESVDLDEGEINVLLGDWGKPAAAPGKAGDKAPAAEVKAVDVGILNARIHNGMVQFAAPLSLNIFTVMGTLIVQADGNFVKHGGTYVYDPDTLYVGGCPVSRIPFAKDYVMGKFLFAKPVPEDIAAAWSKLVSVQIQGTTLHLGAP
jgi:hypothetical protein